MHRILRLLMVSLIGFARTPGIHLRHPLADLEHGLGSRTNDYSLPYSVTAEYGSRGGQPSFHWPTFVQLQRCRLYISSNRGSAPLFDNNLNSFVFSVDGSDAKRARMFGSL